MSPLDIESIDQLFTLARKHKVVCLSLDGLQVRFDKYPEEEKLQLAPLLPKNEKSEAIERALSEDEMLFYSTESFDVMRKEREDALKP